MPGWWNPDRSGRGERRAFEPPRRSIDVVAGAAMCVRAVTATENIVDARVWKLLSDDVLLLFFSSSHVAPGFFRPGKSFSSPRGWTRGGRRRNTSVESRVHLNRQRGFNKLYIPHRQRHAKSVGYEILTRTNRAQTHSKMPLVAQRQVVNGLLIRFKSERKRVRGDPHLHRHAPRAFDTVASRRTSRPSCEDRPHEGGGTSRLSRPRPSEPPFGERQRAEALLSASLEGVRIFAPGEAEAWRRA